MSTNSPVSVNIARFFFHFVNGPLDRIVLGIPSSDVVNMGRGSRKMTVIYPEDTSPFDGERRCSMT